METPTTSPQNTQTAPQPVAEAEPTPSPVAPAEQAPTQTDQAAAEAKKTASKYPEFIGFDDKDPSAAESLEKTKQLLDRLTEHFAKEKNLPPELVKALIPKIVYNKDLYQGNPDNPICCVDYQSQGRAASLTIAPEFFQATEDGQLYNLSHELGHQIIHQGLLYRENPEIFEQFIKVASGAESAEKVDLSQYPELSYALKIIKNPGLARGESIYIQHMMTNLHDEAKLRQIFDNTKTTYEKTDQTFREKFIPHYVRQLAEEIINERMSCYLASDGSFDNYLAMVKKRITEKDSEGFDSWGEFIKELLKEKGEDPAQVDAYKAAKQNPQTPENQQLIAAFEAKRAELIKEWSDSHQSSYEKFKDLKDAKIPTDDDFGFDMGMPFYEGGFGGGGGGGLGIWDWVWGEWVGKPISI